jgi:ketosteroid isomerase-like protein
MPALRCDNPEMSQTANSGPPLAERVRQAFAAHDLHAFGAILSDDVTWGDVDTPEGCRNRRDVLATFARVLDQGVDGRITELETGSAGILCGLAVTWPAGDPRADVKGIFHVYMVRGGQIYQIRRYDDRASAAEAAGVS